MANQYTFEIPGSFKPTNPYPTDYYYGPWTSTTAALLATTGTRYSGQTVCVVTGGVAQLYWFKTGIADGDLVLKDSGAVGNFLSISGGTVTGNTNFTGNLSASTIYSGSSDLQNLFLPAKNIGGGAYQFSGGNNSVKFGYFNSFRTVTDSANFLTSLSVNDSGNGIIFQSKGKLTGSTDNKFSILPDFVRFQTTGIFGAQVHTDLLDADYDYQFPTQGGTFAMVSDLDGLISDASNGITKTGSTVELGGSLIHDTVLTGDTYNFDIYSKVSLNNKYGGFNDGGSGFNGFIFQTLIQPDEKVLVSGFFNTYNGVNAVALTRLNPDGSIDSSFNSGGTGFDQTSRTIELQSDGKIIVGGSFTNYNGNVCPGGLVRLTTGGTLDATFNNGGAGFDPSDVEKIKLQADGKILVAGNFTTYNGVSTNNLIRINSDGTLDTAFNSGGTGFIGSTYSLELQSDGKILVVGNFGTYNGVSCPQSFVRLNSDGSIDNTFNNGGAGFDGIAGFAKVLSDGKIIVGGGFSNYNGAACPSRLVRINSDGTLDATFNNGGAGIDSGGYVIIIEIQSDDKILVGGDFSTYNGVSADSLVRINTDGTIDTSFNNGGSGFSDPIRAISIQSDGKILAGGQFSTYNGTSVPYGLVKLNTDGSLTTSTYRSVLLDGPGALRYNANYHDEYTDRTLVDKEFVLSSLSGLTGSSSVGNFLNLSGGTVTGNTSFLANEFNVNANLTFNNIKEAFIISGSGFSGTVNTFAIQPDGKYIVGGAFTAYDAIACPQNLVRLNSDGSYDSTFNSGGSGFDQPVNAITIQSNGKILVGGQNSPFTTYNGVACSQNLVRINSDGTIDSSFNNGGSGTSSLISSIEIQSDGKILVGGFMGSYNGITLSFGFMRLNTDGSLETAFDLGGPISKIIIQSDDKILLSGYFNSYSGSSVPYGLIRLNSDTTLDTSFNNGGSGASSPVVDMALQSDGKIVIAGFFGSYNGSDASYIARINTNGTFDSSFNTSGSTFNNPSSFSVDIQSDGKVIVGGQFTSYSGISTGKIVRLTTGGTLDTSFNSGGTGFDVTVRKVMLQTDSNILVGGEFTTYNSTNYPDGLIKLNQNGTIDTGVDQSVVLNGIGGLRYGGKYHSQYLNRSLVDKEYVDTAIFNIPIPIVPTPFTFSNALTLSSNNVKLGGALVNDTLISGSSFGLSLGNISNEINTFDVFAKTSLNQRYGGFNLGGSGLNNFPYVVQILPGDKMLVGGIFTNYNGIDPRALTRLNSDGSYDSTFNSGGTGFDYTINAIAIQSDGKYIAVGDFTTYNGVSCPRGIVRITTGGTIDSTFNSGGFGTFGGAVKTVEILSDGKILAGGNIVSYNLAVSPKGLIKLTTGGTLDTSFNTGGAGFTGTTSASTVVNDINVLSDGKILAAGQFSIFNGVSCPASMVRLNSGGTLDTSFNNSGSGFNLSGDSVYVIKTLSNGKILVGGYFTQYNGVTCSRNLICLNSDGTLDTTFNSGGAGFNDSVVFDINVLSNGKILVGGSSFTTYNGISCNSGIVILNSDGTLDTTFNSGGAGFNGSVNSIIVQSDGRIVLGGYFQTYNGVNCSDMITRLNPDGTLDSFTNRSVLFNGYGALRYAANYHTEYNDRTLVDKAYVNNMISSSTVSISTLAGSGLSKILSGSSSVIELGGTLNHDTILTGDTYNFDLYSKLSLNNKYKGFNEDGSGFSVGSIYSTTVLSDGKILASGVFSGYNGSDCSDNLIGLNSDGSVDSTFNSGGTGFNGYVLSTTLQSDGKIIVGGDFTTYNGVDCSDKLVRLNTNGTVDSTFNSGGTGFNSFVNSTTILSDGKILVIGVFASYNGDFDCPNGLARLNSNGTLDSTFNTGGFGFDNQVRSAAIQSDGKIIVGGLFTTYNGANCPDKLARINSDGTIDSTFNIGGTGFTSISDILSVTLQSDGKIIVGGDFTTYNGVSCSDYLVRIDTDGYVDSTFNSGGTGFNNYVRSAVVQSDGKIIVGGQFTTYNGIDCQDRLVRLNSDGTIDSTFNVGGSGFDGEVLSITVQSNGKILVGGNFASYNGSACPDKLVRLNSDGTLDINKNTKVLLNGDGALRYEANYHDEYTDRSLVDKEYVDSSIANNNLSGINGINIANGLASLNGNFIHASNNGDSEITLTDTSFNVKIANNYSLYDRTAYDNSGNTVFNWDKGFIERHFTTQSVDYTVQPTDYVIIINGSGPITITLPSASDHYGRELIFKHSARGSDVTTIDGAGSTIDGQPTHLMTSAYTSVRLFSDNTDWFVVGN